MAKMIKTAVKKPYTVGVLAGVIEADCLGLLG